MASSSLDGNGVAEDAPKLPALTAVDATAAMVGADGVADGSAGTTSPAPTDRPAPEPPAPAAAAPAENAPPQPPTTSANSESEAAPDAPENSELESPTKQLPPTSAPEAAPRRPPVSLEDKEAPRLRAGSVVTEGNGWPATLPSGQEPTPLYMPRQPPRPVRRAFPGQTLPWRAKRTMY